MFTLAHFTPLHFTTRRLSRHPPLLLLLLLRGPVVHCLRSARRVDCPPSLAARPPAGDLAPFDLSSVEPRDGGTEERASPN